METLKIIKMSVPPIFSVIPNELSTVSLLQLCARFCPIYLGYIFTEKLVLSQNKVNIWMAS